MMTTIKVTVNYFYPHVCSLDFRHNILNNQKEKILIYVLKLMA